MRQEWISFNKGNWTKEIDVRDFIQMNYTPYDGDDAFLAGPTKATQTLWDQVMELTKQEQEKAVCWIWTQKSFPLSPLTARDI